MTMPKRNSVGAWYAEWRYTRPVEAGDGQTCARAALPGFRCLTFSIIAVITLWNGVESMTYRTGNVMTRAKHNMLCPGMAWHGMGWAGVGLGTPPGGVGWPHGSHPGTIQIKLRNSQNFPGISGPFDGRRENDE